MGLRGEGARVRVRGGPWTVVGDGRSVTGRGLCFKMGFRVAASEAKPPVAALKLPERETHVDTE